MARTDCSPTLAIAAMLDHLGVSYETEYRFAPPRRWRFDFAVPSMQLAIEIDGAVWTGGRHTRGSGFEKDREKDAAALLAGWRVLHVTPGQVSSGQALHWIERLVEAHRETD